MASNPNRVHVSTGVTKLGPAIPTVNLPAVVTCNPNAPCFKGCYARHGRFLYSNVKNRLSLNLDCYRNDPKQYFKDIALATSTSMYARWHSSGDIVDEQYLSGMCYVARKNPRTRYLAFTKQFPIVNKYVSDGHRIPKNLTIVYSCWEDWVPDNPHCFPTTWVYFPKDAKGYNNLIPSDAKPCSGKCATCQQCWHLKKNQSVVFKKH